MHDSYISPRDYGIGDERGEGGCVPFFINNQKINLPAKRILIRSKGCKIRVEAMPPEIPASRCSYLPDNNFFFKSKFNKLEYNMMKGHNSSYHKVQLY